ncbi:hypothetical protein H4R20_000655 [Coemansia guatemalensis]|uniref:Uncharacterized protein n=1 Tax=Coemansia guatemalensis TaxID=2761395 RepID=A0A9W8I5U2_9FUNG|nr:hypothetical protein H4R20_000655 [Coemansia guatemalensis]
MEQHMDLDGDSSHEGTASDMVAEGAASSTSGCNENAVATDMQTSTNPPIPSRPQSPTISTTDAAAAVESERHCLPVPKEVTRSSSSSSGSIAQEENAVCPNNEQPRDTAATETKNTTTRDGAQDDDSAICPHIEQSAEESSETTPKQVYGMLCWLLMDDNVKQWRQDPLAACKKAVGECPHLEKANPQRIRDKIEFVDERREQILEQHGGKAECVPRETRVCPNGPLFVIVNHVLSGNMTEKARCAIAALIRVHAFGDSGTPSGSPSASAVASGSGQGAFAEARGNITSAGWRGTNPANCGGGPTRKQYSSREEAREPNYLACRQAHRQGQGTTERMQGLMRQMQGPTGHTRLPNYQMLLQRARKLTPQEISQMKDEMEMRREITLRDARLMADWVAMKRREYEMKELKVREFIKSLEDESFTSLEQCEDYLRRLNEEL